ncbi:MAG: Fic family protein [Candidatus Schekmanbacteria bacterium]|nr:Fic family protein [Candidatus Schekmanbacteria bacterium]
MTRLAWRWEERDFGFRFRAGKGRQAGEYYQARSTSEFYVVPGAHRKLAKERLDELAKLANAPTSPRVVASPWRDYDRGWDWIITEDGICLNWAGCLDKEEIHRREDEGVQRAMELVTDIVEREEPVPLSLHLVQQVHVELMGAIYPFAGVWRTVALHKGDGPTKWPLPPGGIQPLMDVLERDVFARSPLITEDDEKVFDYASEVMNEFLALHPFREGNGRAAFIIGNLILMQNDMLPLAAYERRTDEARYYAACEAGRLQKDYAPLAALLAEWEDRALARWRETHG